MSNKFLVSAICYDKYGRIIAKAKNSYKKTHPIQAHFARLAGKPEAIYLHAEIAAILKCNDRPFTFRGKAHEFRRNETPIHRIRVERHTKDGNPALAKPCPICIKAINAWGIKHVEHT